jgi:hypothetical protein
MSCAEMQLYSYSLYLPIYPSLPTSGFHHIKPGLLIKIFAVKMSINFILPRHL